jgi:hypothetical protein
LNKKLFPLFLIFVAISVACNPASKPAASNTPSSSTTATPLSVNGPAATRFTYRLSGLVNEKKGDSKEITVVTQPATIAPIQVVVEFDRSDPVIAIDLNNPTGIDLSTIDPNNFDPADFMPKPIESQAEIGSQGGEVSVKGSSLTATWKSSHPDFVPIGISGATATDKTTFDLKVTKTKK